MPSPTMIELEMCNRHVQNAQMPALRKAAELMCEGLIVYDNYSVFALAGNANDPRLQDKIVDAKGSGRGLRQPVGWTVPFTEEVLSTVDVSYIEHDGIKKLFRDPDHLTVLVGGLSFLRGKADYKKKDEHRIPDSIIPPDGETVQIYSPDGILNTSRLIRYAQEMGAEPVMTSANVSAKPESVYLKQAQDFAEQSAIPLPVVINKSDEDKPDKPRGSYPVISIGADRLTIIRTGCFAPEILLAILSEYPVDVPHDDKLEKPKYPDNVLTLQDLPEDIRTLKNQELRLGVLSHMGAQ